MNPRTALVLVAASTIVLAACGSDDDSSSSGSSPTADDLAGNVYESTGVTGHDLVPDSTITIGFEADTIGATAGCNSMSGGYTITDDTLEIGVMASTMMACGDALATQDTWLNDFLTSGPSIMLDGEALTLSGGDTTITLAARQPAALEGTTWIVTGTVVGEAVSTTPGGPVASLTILDGNAAIKTGCNAGSSSVEVTDSTMTFGPVALTRKACPPEETALEQAVTAVLDGEVTYEVDGATLSIRKDGTDGETGLELAAR
jgi:heat shock protein HslJ